MVKNILKTSVFAAAAAVLVAPSVFASSVNVNPLTDKRWKVATEATGAAAQLVSTDPGYTDKYGKEVLQLTTSKSDIDSAVEVKNLTNNLTLGHVNTLSYDAQPLQGNSPQAGSTTRNPGSDAALRTAIDTDNDGLADTTIVYEPYLSDNNQNNEPVVADQWATWDVTSGYVWLTEAVGSLPKGNAGANLVKFTDVQTAFPDAKVLSVGVSAGSYNPDAKFNVDLLTINDTVYNFEKTASSVSTPSSKDDCKKDGFKKFKDADGKPMFKNQGQCVSSVAKTHHDARKS